MHCSVTCFLKPSLKEGTQFSETTKHVKHYLVVFSNRHYIVKKMNTNNAVDSLDHTTTIEKK